MRIAVWHNLSSGGAKRALFDQVHKLTQRGHYVEAWCPSTADRTYLPLDSIIKENVIPLCWKEYPAPNTANKIRRGIAYFTNYRALRHHCEICAVEINANKFDILFANSCIFTRASPIGRSVDLPKVLYLQEPYRYFYEASPRLPWIALPVPRTVNEVIRFIPSSIYDAIKINGFRIRARDEVQNAMAYDSILVNSLFSRESVLRAYGLNSTVCYLGIDTNKFKALKVHKENQVITAGAMIPEKNALFIIDAVSRVKDRPKLVWVANIVDRQYAAKAISLAVERKLQFEIKNCLTDRELVIEMNKSLVFVYAPRLEPFGYVPLEANACEIPVVAVAEGGVRETIVNGVNGMLVEPDPKEMAKAISKLLSNEKYRMEMGNEGRKIAKKYWSIDSSITRLERHLIKTTEKQGKYCDA